MNSFGFDWLLRQRAVAHVRIYILADLPVPDLLPEVERFLAHGCLRLCCNHRGFAAFWAEQLDDASPRRSWSVIAEDVDRWRLLRAVMDAVVAHAYGVDRSQYERILGSFSHKLFPTAAALCLAAFDELSEMGMPAFCRAHDPYCDIPLVATLAGPNLPVAGRCGV